MRRVARTAAIVALVATAVPFARVEAAPSSARWRLWRITRVGAEGRPVGLNISVSASTRGALALVVGVTGTGSGRRVVSSQFWEQPGGRAVYREGTATPVCPASTCPPDDPGAAQFRTGDNRPVRHEYLVLTWGATARTTFDRDRPGWLVREVAAPPVRRITTVDAGTTGVSTGESAVEYYDGLSAAGGARGSLAWASVPCDGGGFGSAQLAASPTVPDAPRTLGCLADDKTEIAAFAPRAVRWTVTARVVGIADQAPITRAVIADLAA